MNLIAKYISEKILSESYSSTDEQTRGMFRLSLYAKHVIEDILNYYHVNHNNHILFLLDNEFGFTHQHNFAIHVNRDVMAQYRNENLKEHQINLDKIRYLVFVPFEDVDTLLDIDTITPDDIARNFESIIAAIDLPFLDRHSKIKLQKVAKVFLKEVDELDPFQMESFTQTTLCHLNNGNPIEDAMGLSLNILNAFKCHKFFVSLKKNDSVQEVKKLAQSFKTLSAGLAKRVGNKTLDTEILLSKRDENREEFDHLKVLDAAKYELINKFIVADYKELLHRKAEFSQLDWQEDYVYRLFEKTLSDTSKALGAETVDLLGALDIDLHEYEKNSLFQYDALKASERLNLHDILEPIYKKYKGYIESNKALRNKWDKFLYPSQTKSDNFILGLLDTIKKLKADVENIDHIEVTLKQTQTAAIIRNYTKYAIDYLHKRYAILNRVSQKVHFDFKFIIDIDERLTKQKLSAEDKKFRKGSLSKASNELHFIVYAKNSTGETLKERKLIWSYEPNTLLNGYKEDVEAIQDHLKNKKLYSNIVYRASSSEKGEKKPLSLYDFSSLETRGHVSGYRLFSKKNDLGISSKDITLSAQKLLDSDSFNKFQTLFTAYMKQYAWLLNELDILSNVEKSVFDFDGVEKLSQAYIALCHFLYDNSVHDVFKSNVIEPFLTLLTIRVGQENMVLIPAYHPLRLISYFVKLKYTFNFVDNYITSAETPLIKEDLFFNDLEQSFTTPYYPEVFRLFDVEGNEQSILHISEAYDDYTILEPVQNFLNSGQSADPSSQSAILSKVIENYLELNQHKQSSLKVLLHAVNNYDFPVKFMKKLMSLDFTSQENNFEIYLNDVDATHIRKMYRAFLVNQNNQDAEEALEYNEVSFLSNIRLNAFDQSFKQLDTVNDQLNIAFLNDFVSSKAKIEFRKQLLEEPYSLFDFHPTMWSKRKYMTQQESSVGKYLVSPAKSELTSSFYNLLYLTISTHRDDYTNKIPTLKVDRQHKSLHSDLEAIHKRTDWVVNLDALLDKKILEEFGANVIKYRKARHINRNLVISSKANTILLENHLMKKFKDFHVREDIVKTAVENIIKSANELSGDVLLKAIGKGCFANEMLGLVLSKTILEGCSANQNILILIDDYADWFLSSISSEEKLLIAQNNVLADILVITPIFEGEKLKTIYIDVVESKFCSESSRAQMAKKSLQQTKDSYTLFNKVFEDNTYVDREYWIAKISDLIVENHHKSFVGNLTSEDIRNAIRIDKSIKFIVRGMSFVCVYDYEENYQPETGIENVTQYIIGSKSIVKIIEGLPQFDLMLPELKLPSYSLEVKTLSTNTTSSDESRQVRIIEDDRLLSNIKSEVTQMINDSKKIESVNNAIKNAEEIAKKGVVEQTEGDAVSVAVKQVVMHHGYRAKIIKYLFTPNAIRVSLEPELGWNENIFYKMSNDFLAVKMLKLLRVEVVPGSYDLVFSRKERQIIFYEDCLVNREFSNGFGNTKILIGRNEEDNGVVYYDLDSEDPHALIGGMTKSGKSVLLNIFIVDLIRTNTPSELRLILVDPKQVEFTRYRRIPYLDKTGIITKKEQAIEKLHSLVNEMEQRYSLFAETGVNEIMKYNAKVKTKLPRIVLIFDEFADWMLDDEFKREVSSAVQSLSGKARAAGIHLIVSTQRPDNSVVVPILRANLGAKFALRVDSEKNSVIILDEGGAEKLLGYGHMITKFAGKKQYIQTAFISDETIESVLNSMDSF